MNKVETGKEINKTPLVVLFVLFTCFVFYAALFPFHGWCMPEESILWIVAFGWLDYIFLFDIIQNLLFFLPFGLLLSSYLLLAQYSRKTVLLLPTLLSFIISLSIELLQTFNPARMPSLLDCALNVISGFLGAVCALYFVKFYPLLLRIVKDAVDMGNKQNLWPILGLFSWLGFGAYQVFPFIPTLHPHQLLEGVMPLYQFIKGDVPFYLDRLFLYSLQGSMLYFSGKLFIKSKYFFSILSIYASLMLIAKIAIIGRYLTIEMLIGCFGCIFLLSMAQKMMEIVSLEDKNEIEVPQ